MNSAEVIYALSSGAARAGVAVIRVSGEGCLEHLPKLFQPMGLRRNLARASAGQLPEAVRGEEGSSSTPRGFPARVATLGRVIGRDGTALDHSLCLPFVGPRSFTGEDSFELHVHGGPAVVRASLSAIAHHVPCSRPARAGEFTLRALHAGKLDTRQAEGVGLLVAAETEAERAVAFAGAAGDGGAANKWRGDVVAALATAEAMLDFGEDEEIGSDAIDAAAERVRAVATEMREHLERARRIGPALESGLRVALVGPPNSGKSSTLNALAGSAAAIVSPEPGTTRDPVSAPMEIAGHRVVVTDTAGVRTDRSAGSVAGTSGGRGTSSGRGTSGGVSAIETVGIAMAMERARDADAAVFVLEADLVAGNSARDHRADLAHVIADLAAGWGDAPPPRAGFVVAINKCDDEDPLGGGVIADGGDDVQPGAARSSARRDVDAGNVRATLARAITDARGILPRGDRSAAAGLERLALAFTGAPVVPMSCVTGDGLEILSAELEKVVRACVAEADDPLRGAKVLLFRERHRVCIERCLAHLEEFNVVVSTDLEIAAEELRLAANQIGELTGEIVTDEILDAIFSKFCIGK